MLRILYILFVLVFVAAPIALVLVVFDKAPIVPEGEIVDGARAAAGRQLVTRAREVAQGTDGTATLDASEEALAGLLGGARRIARGLRSEATIDETGVIVAASFVGPGPIRRLGWVNLVIAVAPSTERLDVRAVRIGRVELPPEWAVPALRAGLDAMTSRDLGTLLLESVQGVAVGPGTVRLAFDSGALGDDSLFDQAAAGVREAAGFDVGPRAAEHYAAMAEAAGEGRLPDFGPAAAWAAFALERVAAAEHADEAAAAEDLRAAIVALAAHCGDPGAIERVAGDVVVGASRMSACNGTRFGGRIDLRKHFMLSAGFQALGGSAVSFGLGEMKELVDSGAGGSGYSFDDIAADRAGIAWAEAAAEALAAGRLAALAEDSAREGAIVPEVDDLPSLMPESEFRRLYGRVDSARYAAQIDRIDARIAALPIHSE